MNALRRFIYDFKNSFYNPEFYKDLHKRTFGSAVINLIFFGLIAGVTIVIFLLIATFPEGTHSNIKQYVADIYPEELVITLQDGEVSTNLNGPYIIPFNDEDLLEEAGVSNLLVIDTSEGVVIDDLKRYKTMALLSKDRIIFNSTINREGNEIQVFELAEIDDMTVDEAFVLNLLDRLKFLYYILLIIIPLFIISFVTAALVASYLILTLFGALATLVVSKIGDLNYSYRDAYVVSLFAMIPVIVYDFITDILGFGNLFSLGALVYLAVIILNLKKREVINNETL